MHQLISMNKYARKNLRTKNLNLSYVRNIILLKLLSNHLNIHSIMLSLQIFDQMKFIHLCLRPLMLKASLLTIMILQKEKSKCLMLKLLILINLIFLILLIVKSMKNLTLKLLKRMSLPQANRAQVMLIYLHSHQKKTYPQTRKKKKTVSLTILILLIETLTIHLHLCQQNTHLQMRTKKKPTHIHVLDFLIVIRTHNAKSAQLTLKLSIPILLIVTILQDVKSKILMLKPMILVPTKQNFLLQIILHSSLILTKKTLKTV